MSMPPLNNNNNNAAASRTGSPIPANPLRGALMERHFTLSGFTPEQKQRIAEYIKTVGDRAQVVECYADEPPPTSVTHVVVPDRPQSVKALCALVSGRWIVNENYIRESVKLGFWANEENTQGTIRCPDYPLRGQEVLLLGVENQTIYDALKMTVEYGEGRVVPDSWTSRKNRSKYLIISSGSDIVRICEEGL